jgi:hypothetical protein
VSPQKSFGAVLALAQAHRSEIPLDTLGKLAARRHRLFGSCLDCALRYRYELGARNQPSQYDIDIGALVAERGRDCLIVGMKLVPCPYCLRAAHLAATNGQPL